MGWFMGGAVRQTAPCCPEWKGWRRVEAEMKQLQTWHWRNIYICLLPRLRNASLVNPLIKVYLPLSGLNTKIKHTLDESPSVSPYRVAAKAPWTAYVCWHIRPFPCITFGPYVCVWFMDITAKWIPVGSSSLCNTRKSYDISILRVLLRPLLVLSPSASITSRHRLASSRQVRACCEVKG